MTFVLPGSPRQGQFTFFLTNDFPGEDQLSSSPQWVLAKIKSSTRRGPLVGTGVNLLTNLHN